jgi:hypothetical protein
VLTGSSGGLTKRVLGGAKLRAALLTGGLGPEESLFFSCSDSAWYASH